MLSSKVENNAANLDPGHDDEWCTRRGAHRVPKELTRFAACRVGSAWCVSVQICQCTGVVQGLRAGLRDDMFMKVLRAGSRAPCAIWYFYIYTYMCVYIYIYTHMYIYIYMYIYIHIHIHIYFVGEGARCQVNER